MVSLDVVTDVGFWEGFTGEVFHEGNMNVLVVVSVLCRGEILAAATEHEELEPSLGERDGAREELHCQGFEKDSDCLNFNEALLVCFALNSRSS